MAAALARVELAAAGAGSRLQVLSAGVSAEPAGRPMAEPAVQTLRQLDVPVPAHRSRQLTADMCANAVAIYCMAEAQRAAVVELVPHLRDRVHRLDPRGDIPEPNGAADGYLACAVRLRELIRQRLPAVHADAAIAPAGS
jgi:protein-tyrosine-phosphatase